MEDPKTMGQAFSHWNRDSEYWRLLAAVPPHPYSSKKIQEWIEKDFEKSLPDLFFFMIRTREDDRLIGQIGLDGVLWNHGDSFVGIGIGERDCWDKGYGTDAMRIMLRYAFIELNLQRVSLTVFQYNPRAIRSYEKAGFSCEGRERGVLHRDGQRYDLVYMGILREEWQVQFSTPEPGP
jgi:RimJ/RimL family protein N-acetyltransferase